jgi:Bbp16
MIVDSLLKLSAAQQVTADAVSGNTIDLGNVTPKRKIGAGEPMAVVVAITAVGTNSGSAVIQAVYSASAALTTPTVIGEIDLVTADIVAGGTFIIPIGQGLTALRYFGINYDITGVVDFTVDAYLMPLSMASVKAPESYADAITIS